MNIKIIYYVHGTLTQRNIKLSLWGLNQTICKAQTTFSGLHEAPRLVIVNSGFSDGLTSQEIRKQVLLNLPMAILGPVDVIEPPKTKNVAADIQWQIDNIIGADWYLCAKADFVLPRAFYTNMVEFCIDNTELPVFVNCAKFDLREHVSDPTIVSLISIPRWDLIANLPQGCPHYNVPDWGDHKHFVGYDGIDGCFHFYSEEARKKLKIPHFMNQETWNMNKRNGIQMCHGDWRFFGLHVWHDIPRPDPKKAKIGHRF